MLPKTKKKDNSQEKTRKYRLLYKKHLFASRKDAFHDAFFTLSHGERICFAKQIITP